MNPLRILPLLPAVLAAQEGPLTLQDAIAAALKEQPALKAAEASAEAAARRADQASLDRLGKLDTSYLWTPRQKNLEVAFPGIPPLVPASSFEVEQLQEHAFTASFTQPLWTWGALARKADAAGREAEAGKRSLDRARQKTVFDAASAFLRAAQAQAWSGVAAQALEQQRAFLKVAKSRVEAGAAPRLDQLKAELAVAKAESDLLEARNQARLAREALVTLTLDPRFRSAPLAPPPESDGALPEEEAAVARALKQRPDLAALGQAAEAFRLGGDAAAASGKPALAFRASVTQQNDAAGRMWNGESRLYQAGLALTWEGFSPLRARARAAELHASGLEARHRLRAAEEGVALEVRSALSSAREADERSEVQRRALGVAEEQVRIARLAYREGVITSVEAEDAELALTAARFSLTRARMDAALARAQLGFALGD
ncbi:MAG: TolC family protein [Holophagaceae bacterium]